MKKYIFIKIGLFFISSFTLTMEIHTLHLDKSVQLFEQKSIQYLAQLKLDPFIQVLVEFQAEHEKQCYLNSQKENLSKVHIMLKDKRMPQTPVYIQKFLNRYQGVINFTGSNNPRFDQCGNTALHLLVKTGKLRLLKVVLEKFPESNFFVENFKKETPYSLAEEDHPKIKSIFDELLIPSYLKGRSDQLRTFNFDSFNFQNSIKLLEDAFVMTANKDHSSYHQLRNNLGHAVKNFLQSSHAKGLDLNKPLIMVGNEKVCLVEYAGMVNSIVGFQFLMQKDTVKITDKVFENLYAIHKDKKSKILRFLANELELSDKLKLNSTNKKRLASFKNMKKRTIKECTEAVKKQKCY